MPYTPTTATSNAKVSLGYHAFIFLVEGEKTLSYPLGTRAITSEHFFFLPKGNCLMSEKTATGGKYKSLLLFISNEGIADALDAFGPGSASGEHLPKVLARDSYITNFIASLELLESTYSRAQYACMANAKARELLLYLIAREDSLLTFFRFLSYESTEESLIKRAVQSHLYTPVTVEQLAFLCNMSLSTFKRKFERLYDDSPRQWLLRARMYKAAELLSKGKSASELHDELGYGSLSSFIQSFKKVHGVTPRQYRSQK